jgi:hypothetical protein
MKVFATGRVHPERANVHFSEISWSADDGSTVAITCDASQLFVSADFRRCDGYVSAYLQAEHVAETVVSALGFALGTGYSVEMIQLVGEPGTSHVFGVRAETCPSLRVIRSSSMPSNLSGRTCSLRLRYETTPGL